MADMSTDVRYIKGVGEARAKAMFEEDMVRDAWNFEKNND